MSHSLTRIIRLTLWFGGGYILGYYGVLLLWWAGVIK